MVQGIVAQSGGYIDVYSEPGQGTTFKIYLPALAEAAADAGKPAAVPALGGKETVLVVEDQAEVRDYAVAVLKAYGYRVIEAENAGEALLLCERERGRIDLVLTDVVMPNVSGRELADRLEKLQPGIKVLFMSGYTDNVIVHHGVLEEGAEFIQKPFSPEQLAGKIRAVLSLWAAARISAQIITQTPQGGRGGAQFQPARPLRPEDACTLEGRTVNSVTGEPVKWANVTLQGGVVAGVGGRGGTIGTTRRHRMARGSSR